MISYILVFLISAFAAVLHASIGFGYIIIFMALVPLILPARMCLMVATVVGCSLSLWIMFTLIKKVEFSKVWIPALLSSVSGLVALRFSVNVGEGLIMKGLGILLVFLGIWMMRFASRVHIKPSAKNGVIFGTIAGVMSAFFGVSAPPLALYYTSVTEDKDHYNACLQAQFLIMGIVSIAGRIGFGLCPRESWLYCIPALAGAIIGKFPGVWLYGKIDEKKFKTVIYIFIAIMGVYIFFSN